LKSENRDAKLQTRHLSLVARHCNPGYREAIEAVRFLKKGWAAQPRVGIVLGSGLGEVVRKLRGARRVSYRHVPHFPKPTVAGHAGTVHLGFWGELPVAMLEGRVHLYEGYAPAAVVFPTRVLALAGIEVLVVTCAAGGISPRATPGSIMLLSDHLNLQGANPLAGAHDSRWGPRFVDMSEAYDPELRRQARRAAARLRLKCFAGIYAALAGPTYETPAEIRALRRLGADAVGMSTVPEVIAARQLGMRVLAMATITNRAAGLSRRPLSHGEVLEVGKRAGRDLARLLDALIRHLSEGRP
jgi:purine-nucleoside phosphorylase